MWLPNNESLEIEYDVRHHVTAAKKNGKLIESFSSDASENHAEGGPGAPARRYGPGGKLEVHGDFEYAYDAQGRMTNKARVASDGQRVDVTRFFWNGWG